MKTRTLEISFRDYQPGKHIDGGLDFAFQLCDTKGWIAQNDLIETVQSLLNHVLSTMLPGDSLRVTIEVQTP